MYELLAICLSLAGLLIIRILVLFAVTMLWRVSSRYAESWRPSIRAQYLFLLRITPGLAAILCIGAVFLPAYLSHEPRQTTEIVTAKLGILAALSLYGIGMAIWRGSAACLATRRLIKDWLQHAEPIAIDEVAIPAFRIRHPFPVIAIVGALRPRLFIAGQIFQSLSGEEIAAAVIHETGHLAARDNLKRGLLRYCQDLRTLAPLGRDLEHAWTGATEFAADEYAARGGAAVALNLASALVKVARLAPRGGRPAVLAGASLITRDLSSISARVLRLTLLASRSPELQVRCFRLPKLAIGAGLSSLLVAGMVMIYSSNFLAVIHSAMECVVSVFQ